VGGSGYSNPGVFRSTDNGHTFTDFSEGLPNTLVFQIVLNQDDSLLFAATEVGAFVCKTWEEQWYSLSDSIIPDQAFWAVDFVDTLNLARFSTYGRGIWDFELDPDVVADFMASSTSIAPNETVDFIDLSSFSPISWEWHFEGGSPETSDEQNPGGIFYSQNGAFDVSLIVSNEQSIDTLLKSDYITVGTVGFIQNSIKNDIVFYPNPVNSEFFVETNKSIDQVLIYSITGDLCKIIEIQERNKASVNVDLTGIPNGTYLVKLLVENEVFTKKIVKK